jgi:hypothetical protein
MSKTEGTVETPYGRLDRAALTQARESYDTAALLRIIGELDELMSAVSRDVGLADLLLRLHSMAHTVIDGAAMSVAADDETLPELAQEVIGQIYGVISTLHSWVRCLEPLENLTAAT